MWGSVRPASQQHTLQSTEQKWSKVLLRPNIRSPNHSPQNPVSSGDSSSVSRRRGKCLQFAAIGWTFGCKYVVYTHTKSGRCREWEAVEFGKQLCDNSSMKLSMSQTGCMTTNNNWKQFHEREYLPSSCYASSIINRRTLNTPSYSYNQTVNTGSPSTPFPPRESRHNLLIVNSLPVPIIHEQLSLSRRDTLIILRPYRPVHVKMLLVHKPVIWKNIWH